MQGLGRRLGYQGFENTGNSEEQVEEAISNLPEEQRSRLNTLYSMVLRQVLVDGLRRNGFSDEMIRQALRGE